MKYFTHKIAIVTGGGSGIGRALCEQLAQAGATVIVAEINGQAAQETTDLICRAGGAARAVRLDVSDARAVKMLVDHTVAEFGRLDFMFNNAGITKLGEVRDQSLENWRLVIDVNLMGVIYGTDAAYKQMVKQGHGHIVNTASLAGLVPQPTSVPYTASKHAVVGLSNALRAEGADLGVRVSVVCPAFIRANMIHEGSVVGVKVADLHARRNLTLMPTADQAARAILNGVARNQEFIIYPFYARLLWWLTRLVSATPLFMRKKIVRDFRKLREKAGGAG
ncbi:MAG: SDR family oxidoreductase [Anaerolineales bacterium]|nr:SDR family oxidoreductase [Anaerolineales bacterium]